MKKHIKIFYGVFFAALVIAMPFVVQARSCGYGPGDWYQALPQEQRETVSKMMQEHTNTVQSIRDQLWAKSRTLDALAGNSSVVPKDIQNLVNETAALRTRLREEHKAFTDRVKKEVGLDMPGYGYGYGMGGYGYGCDFDGGAFRGMGGRRGMGGYGYGCGFGGGGFRGGHHRGGTW